ncbi:fibronectin type III-like domain-contianing protein [Streptomyces sp. NBC_00161]|uniref:fibronectin type III-like domain-contianing protein n=1 Tax=Streptomyces sp. NBC_00161 TaxID=2975671 RepID=UPI0038683963
MQGVEFSLPADRLAHWSTATGAFTVDPGRYEITAGRSAENPVRTARLTVTGPAPEPRVVVGRNAARRLPPGRLRLHRVPRDRLRPPGPAGAARTGWGRQDRLGPAPARPAARHRGAGRHPRPAPPPGAARQGLRGRRAPSPSHPVTPVTSPTGGSPHAAHRPRRGRTRLLPP